MIIDPAKLEVRELYRHLIGLICPRPIAWVSTCSARGVPNLAPFSFFNGVTANPPTLLFSPVNKRDGTQKDTVRNIEANGEFVVNLVSFALAERMNLTSAEYDYEVSEFAACGLTPSPSERVKPPRVAEAPVQIECRLHQLIPVGEGPFAANLVLGRILLIHVDGAVLDEAGEVDPRRLDVVGRMGGMAYTRTRELFELPRPR